MDRERQRPLHISEETAWEYDERRIDVAVAEHDTWTGLYDANGTPLHRPRETIGFKKR